MSIRQDTLMRQIEQITKLLLAMSAKKTDKVQDSVIDQTLAELTGLDATLFADPNSASLLGTLLGMLPDQNLRALAARLLVVKNQQLYGAVYTELISKIDISSLHAKVREVLEKNADF